jgi:hypothetical protein
MGIHQNIIVRRKTHATPQVEFAKPRIEKRVYESISIPTACCVSQRSALVKQGVATFQAIVCKTKITEKLKRAERRPGESY